MVTGTELHQIPVDVVPFRLVASRDDLCLAALLLDDQPTQIWDVKTKKLKAVLKGQGSHTHGCFADDWRRIATLTKDGHLTIWDAESGREMLILRARRSAAYTLCYDPDGKRFITASTDGTREIW